MTTRGGWGPGGLAEECRLLLRGLGATPGAVAASLRAAGARGRSGDQCRCPLANHIRGRLGVPAAVFAGMVELTAGGVVVTVTPRHGEGWPGFVNAVDAGLYPDLVEGEG